MLLNMLKRTAGALRWVVVMRGERFIVLTMMMNVDVVNTVSPRCGVLLRMRATTARLLSVWLIVALRIRKELLLRSSDGIYF